MHTAHHIALEAKHAGLDRQIASETRRPLPDATVLRTLKRRKLKVKEELEQS